MTKMMVKRVAVANRYLTPVDMLKRKRSESGRLLVYDPDRAGSGVAPVQAVLAH